MQKLTLVSICICLMLLPQALWAQGSLSQQIDNLIERIESGKIIDTETFSFAGANFESNSFQIRPESKKELDKLVNLLKNGENIDLIIQGHTDANGSYEYNDRLSYFRAYTVRQYLLQGLGATTSNTSPDLLSRLRMETYGEYDPVADNDSEEGRSKNRRVDFDVVVRGGYVGDLLILCSGDTLGVRLDKVGEDSVYYRTYTSDELQSLPILDMVCDIKEPVDDGPIIITKFDTVTQVVRDTLIEMVRDTVVEVDTFIIDKNLPTITDPECPGRLSSNVFRKGSHTLILGSDFPHNLGNNVPSFSTDTAAGFIPSVSLGYEYGLNCNIGIGGNAGLWHFWEDRANFYYYNVSVRVNFHIPFWTDFIDPYIGVAPTFRGVTTVGRAEIEDVFFDGGTGRTNTQFNVNWLLGVKAHLGARKRWGFVGEVGPDGLGLVRAGVFYVFNQGGVPAPSEN